MGISIRKYAQMRGVAVSAVQKAIKTKRITPNPDGSIDPERANEEWKRNTFASKTLLATKVRASRRAQRPQQQQPPQPKLKPKPKPKPKSDSAGQPAPSEPVESRQSSAVVPPPPPPPPPPSDIDSIPEAGDIAGDPVTAYLRARAVSETFKAKVAELTYEERAGRLIDVSKAGEYAAQFSSIVGDALSAWPDRLTPLIAATTDEQVIHKILSNEVAALRRKLSKAIADAGL